MEENKVQRVIMKSELVRKRKFVLYQKEIIGVIFILRGCMFECIKF